MATKTPGKLTAKQTKSIRESVTLTSMRLQSQDIETWKRAINIAKDVNNPRRKELYELYENIMLDGHLISVTSKRVMAITNQKCHFEIKGKEGQQDEMINDKILNTPWFWEMMKLLMESKAYGHSLVELITAGGFIDRAELIPRIVVKPESGLLAFNVYTETDGIWFREDPVYSKYLIEAGNRHDYGLLMPAAQYAIYKRGGFGDWAQFAELFGMPFRTGKYNAYDEVGRAKLIEALRDMGAAAWAAIPEGTSIEFSDNNGAGKSEVFKDLISTCNAEMSKIFLGQTMTTEDGSSRSQSETHLKVEEGINLSDTIEMEYLLNWKLAGKLRDIGYPVPEGNFYYPQTKEIPLEKRIEMDIQLAQQVPIEEEYWYKTYGIPKPKAGSKTVVKAAPVKEKIQTEALALKDPLTSLLERINEIQAIYTPHDH